MSKDGGDRVPGAVTGCRACGYDSLWNVPSTDSKLVVAFPRLLESSGP